VSQNREERMRGWEQEGGEDHEEEEGTMRRRTRFFPTPPTSQWNSQPMTVLKKRSIMVP
jgi:hypothetical protein